MTSGADRDSRSGRRPGLGGLVADGGVVVTCGPGGVGKTTVAAAIATRAALELPAKVLVVTVDPARRLADALGVTGIGNTETRVAARHLGLGGAAPRGELYAAMLDMKQSWDALVDRHAPDEDTRRRILANPLYRDITGRFVESHDYIAMERLFEVHATGRYDLIVVDTPPARNALNVLDAPKHMADFFSGRLLRWLTMPYRSRALAVTSRPFFAVADRVLGTELLADIAEFFTLFQAMYGGFVERARAVQDLLADEHTAFVVVSTAHEVVLRQSRLLVGELAARRLRLGAVVLNKLLPDYLGDRATGTRAARLRREAGAVANALARHPPEGLGGDAAVVGTVLRTLAENYLDYEALFRREQVCAAQLAAEVGTVLPLPMVVGEVGDFRALLRLGEALFG